MKLGGLGLGAARRRAGLATGRGSTRSRGRDDAAGAARGGTSPPQRRPTHRANRAGSEDDHRCGSSERPHPRPDSARSSSKRRGTSLRRRSRAEPAMGLVPPLALDPDRTIRSVICESRCRANRSWPLPAAGRGIRANLRGDHHSTLFPRSRTKVDAHRRVSARQCWIDQRDPVFLSLRGQKERRNGVNASLHG